MARGWESKSIEEQIESARTEKSVEHGRQLTPEEAERQRKRELLVLSRKHVEAQLAASKHPRHREMLEKALREIEQQIGRE